MSLLFDSLSSLASPYRMFRNSSNSVWDVPEVVNQMALRLLVYWFLLGLALKIGLVGNVMLVYILTTRWCLRSSFTYYTSVLASTQAIKCAVEIPIMWTITYHEIRSYHLNTALCKCYRASGVFFTVCSSLLLTLGAIDRFGQISKPWRMTSGTHALTKCTVVIVFSLFFCIPAFVFYGTYESPSRIKDTSNTAPITYYYGHCTILEGYQKALTPRVFVILLTIMFSVCMWTLVVCYALVSWKSRLKVKKISRWDKYSVIKHNQNRKMSESAELDLGKSVPVVSLTSSSGTSETHVPHVFSNVDPKTLQKKKHHGTKAKQLGFSIPTSSSSSSSQSLGIDASAFKFHRIKVNDSVQSLDKINVPSQKRKKSSKTDPDTHASFLRRISERSWTGETGVGEQRQPDFDEQLTVGSADTVCFTKLTLHVPSADDKDTTYSETNIRSESAKKSGPRKRSASSRTSISRKLSSDVFETSSRKLSPEENSGFLSQLFSSNSSLETHGSEDRLRRSSTSKARNTSRPRQRYSLGLSTTSHIGQSRRKTIAGNVHDISPTVFRPHDVQMVVESCGAGAEKASSAFAEPHGKISISHTVAPEPKVSATGLQKAGHAGHPFDSARNECASLKASNKESDSHPNADTAWKVSPSPAKQDESDTDQPGYTAMTDCSSSTAHTDEGELSQQLTAAIPGTLFKTSAMQGVPKLTRMVGVRQKFSQFTDTLFQFRTISGSSEGLSSITSQSNVPVIQVPEPEDAEVEVCQMGMKKRLDPTKTVDSSSVDTGVSTNTQEQVSLMMTDAIHSEEPEKVSHGKRVVITDVGLHRPPSQVITESTQPSSVSDVSPASFGLLHQAAKVVPILKSLTEAGTENATDLTARTLQYYRSYSLESRGNMSFVRTSIVFTLLTLSFLCSYTFLIIMSITEVFPATVQLFEDQHVVPIRLLNVLFFTLDVFSPVIWGVFNFSFRNEISEIVWRCLTCRCNFNEDP